jgi:hypothetical protein
MRNHAAEVSALAVVVRTLIDELDGRQKPVGDAVRAALVLVERRVAGETISSEELSAARAVAHEDGVPLARREKDRVISWANTAVGNLAWMADKARGWKDAPRSILDGVEYSLSSLNVPGVRDRAALAKLYARELRRPHAPRASAPKKTTLKFENLTHEIGALAAARLKKLKPILEPSQRGTDATLAALLRERGYPVHDAVLAFERRYGGMIVADGPGEEGDDWIFGAFACLRSGAHEKAKGAAALVPVVYSPNDVIYYLDGHGAAFAEDTIEDPTAAPFASDGDRLVARILLNQILFARSLKGAIVEREGRRGEAAAKALGAPLIPEASDALARYWGDDKRLVVEERVNGAWKTRVTGATKAAIEAAISA